MMKGPEQKNKSLRTLPSVDEVLKSPESEELLKKYPRRFVLRAVREEIEELRNALIAGKKVEVALQKILPRVNERVIRNAAPSLRPVINATGIVLHTNLGRSPLPETAIKNVGLVSKGYSNLEYDMEEGKRGKRYAHIRGLLKEITGARDATVVNNNAGAVLICLASLARGREVIVSRGELVEIGGSFRIPDVMAQSGAILREIGTTNKTHLADYENAIGPDTALLLKVHRSNYRITGFTSEVSIEELIALGKKHSIPVMFDLGSGCLIDLKAHGIGTEPVVNEIVRTGVDIVTFSGDKLLGGPQAGLILGRTELIEKVNKNPLARALRIDKMTLAALESVFFEYADPEKAVQNIPTLRMLLEGPQSIRKRAEKIASGIRRGVPNANISVIEDLSEAGGGSLPGVVLPTYAVAVRMGKISANRIEERIRKGNPPVIARIREDALILDARTISPDEVGPVIESVRAALS